MDIWLLKTRFSLLFCKFEKIIYMKYSIILIQAVLLFSCTSKEEGKKEKYLNYSTPLTQLMKESNLQKKDLYVEISKSQYTLFVKHDSEIIKSYPVVLGPDPVNDKFREGDGCTPEGVFKIRDKYPHRKWCRFIWLNYPNDDSWKKHRKAKAEGKIPENASIGGEVGIHGVPAGHDDWIEKGENWTLGCISLKNADIVEIYDLIGKDTRILIHK